LLLGDLTWDWERHLEAREQRASVRIHHAISRGLAPGLIIPPPSRLVSLEHRGRSTDALDPPGSRVQIQIMRTPLQQGARARPVPWPAACVPNPISARSDTLIWGTRQGLVKPQ
jgi:hypothetical protein